jgi:NADH:ubiquinone oxidoreductase subunit 3 (subunit A)
MLPLEGGFWCRGGVFSKFSIQFFVILIVFLLFDIEIVLLAPTIYIRVYNIVIFRSIILFIFVTLGLEGWWGKLKWFDCIFSIPST